MSDRPTHLNNELKAALSGVGNSVADGMSKELNESRREIGLAQTSAPSTLAIASSSSTSRAKASSLTSTLRALV